MSVFWWALPLPVLRLRFSGFFLLSFSVFVHVCVCLKNSDLSSYRSEGHIPSGSSGKVFPASSRFGGRHTPWLVALPHSSSPKPALLLPVRPGGPCGDTAHLDSHELADRSTQLWRHGAFGGLCPVFYLCDLCVYMGNKEYFWLSFDFF